MPVAWVARKLDSLTGAGLAAVGGGAASQWRAFLQQYLQRLGGHLDEARRNVEHLDGLLAVAEPAQQPVLADMVAASQARVDDLAATLRAVTDASAAWQPVAFARHLDPAIARATLEVFQPALPLDPASLAWAGAGLVLTLLVYELVKGLVWAPVSLTRGAARRKRHREAARPRERIEPSL